MDSVIHFEIPAGNVRRAQSFYKSVFKWKINPMPEMDYTIVQTAPFNKKTMMPQRPGSINGGVMKRGKLVKGPVITINVRSIEATQKMVVRNGGKVAQKKMKVGDMGWASYIRDSEGNIIGLWQTAR